MRISKAQKLANTLLPTDATDDQRAWVISMLSKLRGKLYIDTDGLGDIRVLFEDKNLRLEIDWKYKCVYLNAKFDFNKTDHWDDCLPFLITALIC